MLGANRGRSRTLASFACSNFLGDSLKTCKCRGCFLYNGTIYRPCQDNEQSTMAVRLDVGGHYNHTLNAQVSCLGHQIEMLRARAIAVTRPVFLLGRTGPWSKIKTLGIKGLHARVIYDNIIPTIGAALDMGWTEDDLATAMLLYDDVPEDVDSREPFEDYWPFMITRPAHVSTVCSDRPCLLHELVFGVVGRGFHPALAATDIEPAIFSAAKLVQHYWFMPEAGCSGFSYAGTCLPKAYFYSAFQSYRVYRSLMFRAAQVEQRSPRSQHGMSCQATTNYARPSTPKRFLIVNRGTGLSRQWPFSVHTFVEALTAACDGCLLRVVDYAELNLLDQVRTTAWADVFISIHGSNIINRLFLPDGALSLIFYGSTACYRQSDHVDRMVTWSPYVALDFPLLKQPTAPDFSCGIYGNRCCKTVEPASLTEVVAKIKETVKIPPPCAGRYCCNFFETRHECALVAQSLGLCV